MEINAYKKASYYENLIRKSLKDIDAIRNQKAIFIYRALSFSMEDQMDSRAEKQLMELKQYLKKALSKFLKDTLDRSKRKALVVLIAEIDGVIYLTQIDSIVSRSLDILCDPVE